MNPTILVALISALSALVVAAVTYFLSRQRDREADWRKVKLEHYREFIAALSAVTGRRSTELAQVRYSDAVNAMTLVGPPRVLQALYEFQTVIGPHNADKSKDSHDRALATLLRAIRADVHPRAPDDEHVTFQLLDAPMPSSEGDRSLMSSRRTV